MTTGNRKSTNRLSGWVRARLAQADRVLTGAARQRRRDDALRDGIDDPEVLLVQAREQMALMHARNRERAVQAITAKNNLQNLVDETERRVVRLHERAQAARGEGDEEQTSQILREMQSYETTLHFSRQQLEQAIQTADQVKLLIRREEERIKLKSAEMIALQTQWKLVQVEKSLTISLAQLTALGDAPLTRERAGERHRRSRALVIEAITQKNYLATLAAETRRTAEELRAQADQARREDDPDRERIVLRELEQQEATLATTQLAHERAHQITTRARALLEDEAARFRARNWDPEELTGAPTGGVEEEASKPARRSFFQRHALVLIALGVAVLLFLLSLL